MYSPSRNCFEYKENFKDGILISRQGIRKIGGYDSNTLLGSKYELGPVINDVSILKERGSSIKKLDLDTVIDQLKQEGVNFRLLAD